MMYPHLISSWEIMPHTINVCTGDVNIDATVAAILVVAWLIRTKR